MWNGGSETGGVVEESGGDAELPGQLRGEGADAEGLGGVVATVERVDAGFLGEGVCPVGAFPGDEGVDALGGGFLEFGAGAPGADSDALAMLRATREKARRVAKRGGEAGGELEAREGFGELDLNADVLVVVGEEGAPAPEAEGLGESGGVSETWMGVEGKMLGVNGEVFLNEAPDQFGARAGPGRGLSPEQAVVDDEHVAAGFDGHPGDRERAIHGCADLADLASVLELEPVLGTVPVAESGWRKESVGKGDNLGERCGRVGHGVDWATGPFSGFERMGPETEFLGRDPDEEAGIVGEVAFPEPAGFTGEAVEPFEAAALDPSWGLADAARVEVESGTNAEEDGGGEPVAVGGHESFLFRRAEPDPEEVRAAAGNLVDQGGVFSRGQWAEGWCEGADDADSREPLFEPGLEFLGDAGVATIEEVGGAGLLAPGEDPFHEVGAVDSSHGSVTGETAEPDHGHAVRCGQEGTIVDAAEIRVGLGFHDAVDARDTDVSRRPGLDCGSQCFEG